MKITQNKPLCELSTFGIGGPAQYFTEVRSADEMHEAFSFCKEKQIPFFIVGKGSNCLFDDQGFNGLVILNKIDFIENPHPGIYRVGAGYSFPLLGVQTARQRWMGLEFASGIPCTVGGAVYMNAGANGTETCQALESVEYLSYPEFKILHLNKNELNFAYRTSPFQKMKGAILAATFKLLPDDGARTKQLDIVAYRTKTQPYGEKSAGCVFRNPPSGPAGALIDQAGLKGLTVGGAMVSHLHANFIINKGQATSHDVQTLIDIIKRKVHTSFGIDLEIEIRLINQGGMHD